MEISTRPYIGSRDFYPSQMTIRNWMFQKQREVCHHYGYLEYAAPILEPLSLYLAKSSEEIVNEQLYRFTDRGDREVAIRPEMTPTLARMVAARSGELAMPLRWFSIANFMRYERPGRGRLREFYQLNVDLLGSSAPSADAEILLLAMDLMHRYGATAENYTLRFSDRRLLALFIDELSEEKLREVGRLLDKREKIEEEKFNSELAEICPDDSCVHKVKRFLNITIDELEKTEFASQEAQIAITHMLEVNRLVKTATDALNIQFDPGIVRGFDYYTGLIFEINDNHPDNRRALFGGGRYDRLLGMFGGKDIPAVGFGMGDVTLENFLELHGLIPDDVSSASGVFFTLMDEKLLEQTQAIARDLRREGIAVEVALEASGKFKKQLQLAEKKGRRFVLIMGEDEHSQGLIRVKDLLSGVQNDLAIENLADHLKTLLAGEG